MENNYEPVLSKTFKEPNSHALSFCLDNGGYTQAEKVLKEKKPDEVIEYIKQSNLRGRGGAGFPTGVKWGFIPKNREKPVYLVINADESEPGTFKDRVIIENDPHRLVEGIIIAAYAINSHKSFIYIRGEFVKQYKILENAVQEAYSKGFLGRNIFGTGFSLDLTIHRGAGAYICGEETALLNSLEGKRGYPRIKPPFPAIEGLFASPTIVNNVETLICIPHIFEKGIDWFKSMGTEKSPGPKLYCLSGHVKQPGLYELPLAVPLRKIIYECGKGIKDDMKFKAAVPGGASSGVVIENELDILMDFETLMSMGMILGTAAVTVMDESVCMVDALWNTARFFRHESCGQCTPCREGSGWIEKLCKRLETGTGTRKDLDDLQSIAKNMVGRTICALADALAIPVAQYTKRFYSEFEQHVVEKSCPVNSEQITAKSVGL